MKNAFILAATVLLLACKENKADNTNITSTVVDTTEVITPATVSRETGNTQVSDIELLQTDSGTVIQFKAMKDSVQANAFLPAAGHHVYIRIRLEKAEKITASLLPSRWGCNIRFNQTIDANGSMDGPYGRSLSYRAKKSGWQTLVIGHNLMADGIDSCDFVVRIAREAAMKLEK